MEFLLSGTNPDRVRSVQRMYITISIKRILALFLFLVGAAAGILT